MKTEIHGGGREKDGVLERLRLRQGLPPSSMAEDGDVRLLSDWLGRLLEGRSSEGIRAFRERWLRTRLHE